jgi:hypothetical protein
MENVANKIVVKTDLDFNYSFEEMGLKNIEAFDLIYIMILDIRYSLVNDLYIRYGAL